jgi:transcriptional regulator with XRE-family HTH domain
MSPSEVGRPDLAAPPSPEGWAKELGEQLRALRRLAGVSQERLARLIGTSQPAISRLEQGRVVKQVLLVLQIGHAIDEALSRLADTVLTDESRALLRGLHTLTAARGKGATIVRDPGLEELVHIYSDASPTQRRGLLAIARGWRASSRDAVDAKG